MANVKVRPLTATPASPRRFPVRNSSDPSLRQVHLSSPGYKVLRFATASRVVVIILAVVSDWILPDHVPDASVARPSGVHWLSAFTRWDAARFLKIAQEGYLHEEDYAFMPALPVAISIGASIARAVIPGIGPLHLAAVGLAITNSCFVLAAWLLYRLGLIVLQDQLLAYRSATVFCLSPANIFFTSIYTESPFAACSFGGLLLLELNRPLLAAVFFGFGTALRSNGILNAGFLAYYCGHKVLGHIQKGTKPLQVLLGCAGMLVEMILAVAISIGPFLAFQAYAIHKECHVQDTCAEAEQCDLSAQPPSWCQGSVPSVYMHVQKKYWRGGLFCYWQLKQIPNFALAAPALFLTALGVRHILLDFRQQLRHSTLSESKPPAKAFVSFCRAVVLCPLLPHALHWGFLATYLLFCANVQIATRVLGSGCPLFHWFVASLLFSRGSCKFAWLLKCYLGLFNCLGIIMHPNFLPWT